MPGRVVVHEQHRVLAGVLAVGDLALEEDVVGGVERRHVHLHAVQHVVVAVPADGRGDGVDVGARALLGDRVALVSLAAHGWFDPSRHLLGRHDRGCPRGRRVHAPAERVGDAAELLRDERLLQHRHPAAADVLRHVHPREPELDRQAVVPLAGLVGEQALVLLRVDLPRDQLVVDEPPSARPRSRDPRRTTGSCSRRQHSVRPERPFKMCGDVERRSTTQLMNSSRSRCAATRSSVSASIS